MEKQQHVNICLQRHRHHRPFSVSICCVCRPDSQINAGLFIQSIISALNQCENQKKSSEAQQTQTQTWLCSPGLLLFCQIPSITFSSLHPPVTLSLIRTCQGFTLCVLCNAGFTAFSVGGDRGQSSGCVILSD